MVNQIPLPSDRRFGLIFGLIFIAGSAYAAWIGHRILALPLAVVAAGFSVLALSKPSALRTLNVLWFRLGLLIGRVVSPLVLGVIFFLLLSPVGLVTRLFGRDELRLKKRVVSSYWIEREPRGPGPESFKNKF